MQYIVINGFQACWFLWRSSSDSLLSVDVIIGRLHHQVLLAGYSVPLRYNLIIFSLPPLPIFSLSLPLALFVKHFSPQGSPCKASKRHDANLSQGQLNQLWWITPSATCCCLAQMSTVHLVWVSPSLCKYFFYHSPGLNKPLLWCEKNGCLIVLTYFRIWLIETRKDEVHILINTLRYVRI